MTSDAVAVEMRDPTAEHERLVAFVHAVNGDPEPRAGVWREHSYARGRGTRGGAGDAGEPHCRLLLAPRAPDPPDDIIDVESVEPSPIAAPDPPAPYSSSSGEDSGGEEAWDARLEAATRGGGARRLGPRVAALLRGLRLARLAGAGGAREGARDAARRLRRALAPHWRGASPARLHAALTAGGGRSARLWGELAGELARSVPRLAARLTPAPRAAPPPAPRPGPAVMPMSSRPLLVWLGSGCERRDARWERRLRALVPTHYIRLPNQGAAPCGAWLAGALAGAAAGLRALADGAGGEGALALGGAGAGAALAAALARREPRARGLLLLAPRGRPPARPRGLPALLAAGAAAALRWHAPRTRLLLLAGADAELRLPAARRRALRLPQYALDAAIAEECARWLTELAEGAVGEGEGEGEREGEADEAGDECRRPAPPPPRPPPRPPLTTTTPNRAIEIIEGRVVSRACGAVPLALTAPRRAAPPPSPSPPAPAPAPAPRPLPKYTKVIVAKRASGAGAGARGGAGGAGGAAAGSSVLLRGGVRLLRAPPHQ